MKNYYNIESQKFSPNYRTGYRKSDGQAVRIYGSSGKWNPSKSLKWFKTLAEVSKYLEGV